VAHVPAWGAPSEFADIIVSSFGLKPSITGSSGAPFVHTDDTGWKVGGQTAFLMGFDIGGKRCIKSGGNIATKKRGN